MVRRRPGHHHGAIDSVLLRRVGAAAVGGLLVALSVPPWGFWPLAPAGLGLLAAVLRSAGLRSRILAGLAFGTSLFAPTLFWMGEFHLVGYAAVVALETSFFVAAAAAVPGARGGRLAWLSAFPAAVVMAEAARGVVPFGGLPMGGIPLGQAAGPLAPAARFGGALLVTATAAAAGVALADLAAATRARTPRRARLPAALLGVVVLAAAAGTVAPDGGDRNEVRAIDVAVVQGGGQRGFRGVDSDAGRVLQAHLAVSKLITPPVDLVVWPENTIDVEAIDGSPADAALGDLARRLGATVVAGVTEDVGVDRFRNVAVVWSPEGEIVDRYVKAHRVPFGEYVPGRGLFGRMVDLTVLPRDAVAGTGPGILTTPAGRLGVAISFEVFFGEQSRRAVVAGGELLLVPTNAASFTTSQVPTQELAASRLRAWETGRWVVQAAPTGFGAVVDARGRVLARTRLGDAQLLRAAVELRSGRTPYARLGDAPVVLLAAGALAASRLPARRRRSAAPAGAGPPPG